MYAARIQDLPDAETIQSLSGPEIMRGILDGILPGPPMAQTLGYDLYAVEPGRVTFRGTPQFHVMNPMGTVHGGWYGAVLDSAMACAIMTEVPRGNTYTTLEYKVNLIRAIPPGTEVECIGVVSHAGRSTGVAQGEIRGVADGRLYATGSTTCIIMALNGGTG